MPFDFDLQTLSSYLLLSTAFVGAFLAALWLSLVIWTFRDMRTRSRDLLAQILAALVVALLTLPGLVVYLILRPPRTLDEAYQHTLEEEALLQEIEEKPRCPGCGRQTMPGWQICPTCQIRLKKPCHSCGQLMELGWNICPSCAVPVPGRRAESRGTSASEEAPQPQPGLK